MNEPETSQKTGTPRAHACSPIDLRRALIAQREKHGADTEIGHRITNLIGQTDFLPAAFGEHRKNLEALIAKGTAELAELTAA